MRYVLAIAAVLAAASAWAEGNGARWKVECFGWGAPKPWYGVYDLRLVNGGFVFLTSKGGEVQTTAGMNCIAEKQ